MSYDSVINAIRRDYDPHGQGHIEGDSLAHVLYRLGHLRGLSLSDCKSLVSASPASAPNKGEVDYEKFVRWLSTISSRGNPPPVGAATEVPDSVAKELAKIADGLSRLSNVFSKQEPVAAQELAEHAASLKAISGKDWNGGYTKPLSETTVVFNHRKYKRTNDAAAKYSELCEGYMFGGGRQIEVDTLDICSTKVFNEAAMLQYCGDAVVQTFKDAIINGQELDETTKKKLAAALFNWARENGASSFAHWFFPYRGGGGAIGGSLGALKYDTMIDLVWSSNAPIKPFEPTLPTERLFVGETDGSSFPNGGLRATHTAAAFTTWDRSSPIFVLDGVMRVPCCFVTHYGKCIDVKTPLLRSCDAVCTQGLRLLKNMNLATPKANAKTIYSYVGWEQEFFVIPAQLYKARPDLVNCGRTLFGALPTRSQQMDLNYFGPVPEKVDQLLKIVEKKMMEIGVPMAVRHNEVAPGQHEMSPIFCHASASCDNNVMFMEMMTTEAYKLGLVVLFHEKPFAGINGNGKHNNWSVGTDTGINFFYPGKNDDERRCFVAGIAALAYGLKEYNELVRVSVAHAGNDHRLGAQEAPPAIVSLYPGTGFEAHVDAIIAGADLLDYKANKQKASPGCKAAEAIDTNIEDRNRTAPFPFCGNRFEFRAVGSSQNCAFPTTVCNTIWAAGAAYLSQQIERGATLRDAVAQTFKECRSVIFTGNGYSAEWPIEAKKRGLPNLNTTPLAIAGFQSAKNKKVLTDMNVLGEDECEAFAETMYENYCTVLSIEVQTMIDMVSRGFIPAMAKDMANYKDAAIFGDERSNVYKAVCEEHKKLEALFTKLPDSLPEQATYLCDTVKPQMAALRQQVDNAEKLMESSVYPYPTYENLLYSHHF